MSVDDPLTPRAMHVVHASLDRRHQPDRTANRELQPQDLIDMTPLIRSLARLRSPTTSSLTTLGMLLTMPAHTEGYDAAQMTVLLSFLSDLAQQHMSC